jgi:hypothetical protein
VRSTTSPPEPAQDAKTPENHDNCGSNSASSGGHRAAKDFDADDPNQQGEPVSELTTVFGVSRSTVFRTLKVLRLKDPVSV